MRCRIAVIVFIAVVVIGNASGAIKIACVGDSITEGFGTGNASVESYPAVLQSLLGSSYDVHNFGRSGACVLRSGNQPYANDVYFSDGTNFEPNIVAIMLGTNDGKPYNWVYNAAFTNDYQYLVDAYLSCTSHPTILICAPCPAIGDAFDINANTLNYEIIPRIRNYASVHGFTVVDVNARMTGHPEWFGDPIHPNATGYAQIADVVRSSITNLMAADPASLLITTGSTWKYQSTGAVPATNWSVRTYDDGSWSNGAAPLGYGDPSIVTTLGYGGVDTNRWVTYYFRKSFVLTNTTVVTGLTASVIADDGAVLYLNGTKVHTTTNMPEPSDYGSYATPPSVEPYVPETFTINPASLVVGTNVLAVEVHQTSPGSSDVYLDLSLAKVAYATTNQTGGGFPVAITNVAATNVADASAGWTAYNDLSWADSQISNRLTKLTFVDDADHDLTGRLVRYADGVTSPVTLTCAGAVGASLWVTTNQGAPSAGTPAAILFSGKVDMNRTVFTASTNSGTITLTGMDTTRLYRVAVFGNRGDPTYTNRTTVMTLTGAASFTNTSSVGALVSGIAGDTTTITVGTNNGGLVFQYSNIAPGSDGQVVLNVVGGVGNTASWYLNAMLVELQGAGVADIDTDGMDDTWEQTYFGGLSQPNAGASQDWDNDGSDNYSEYRAGTDPTSVGSKLELTSLTATNVPGTAVFRWSSVSNKTYAILSGTNLAVPLTAMQTGIVATPPMNTYTAAAAAVRGFLRIKVE